MTIANPLENVFLGYNELSKRQTLPVGSEGVGLLDLPEGIVHTLHILLL
jgi:hypothetical protein